MCTLNASPSEKDYGNLKTSCQLFTVRRCYINHPPTYQTNDKQPKTGALHSLKDTQRYRRRKSNWPLLITHSRTSNQRDTKCLFVCSSGYITQVSASNAHPLCKFNNLFLLTTPRSAPAYGQNISIALLHIATTISFIILRPHIIAFLAWRM